MNEPNEQTIKTEMPYSDKAWALREEITKVLWDERGRAPDERELRSILCGLVPLIVNCAHRLIEDETGEHPVMPWEHVEPIPDGFKGPSSADGFTIRCVAVDQGAMGGHIEIGLPKIHLMPGTYRDEGTKP